MANAAAKQWRATEKESIDQTGGGTKWTEAVKVKQCT
jgi:hypothetical protein